MFSAGTDSDPPTGNGVEDALSGTDVLQRLVSMSEMRVDAFMTPRADIVAAEVRTEPVSYHQADARAPRRDCPLVS